MKNIDLLIEKYIGNIWSILGKSDVFVNPTRIEFDVLRENGRDVRFIIDSISDNVYVWDAFKSTHFGMYKQLKDKEKLSTWKKLWVGEGIIRNNKIEVKYGISDNDTNKYIENQRLSNTIKRYFWI